MYRGCLGSPSSARLVQGGSCRAARAGRLVQGGSCSAVRAAALFLGPSSWRMPVDERVQSGTETLPATHLRVLLWAYAAAGISPLRAVFGERSPIATGSAAARDGLHYRWLVRSPMLRFMRWSQHSPPDWSVVDAIQ